MKVHALLSLFVVFNLVGCSVSMVGEPYSYCFEGKKYIQHKLVTTLDLDEYNKQVKCVMPSPIPSPSPSPSP